MKESEWQQQIIDLMHTYGWRVGHFRTVRVQRADDSVYYCTPVQADGVGFPDLIALRGRQMLVVECKVGSNKVSPAQSEWLNAFTETSLTRVSYVWYPKDFDDAVKVLAR